MTPRQTEFPWTVAVCAWCAPEDRGSRLGAISHGICPRHLRKIKREIRGGAAKPTRRTRRDLAAGEPLLPL